MTASRLYKKIIKIISFFAGLVLIFLLSFHFWFIHHAKDLVEDLVSEQSHGNLTLRIGKFKFNWFTQRMELRKAVFYSSDTSAATAYRFSVERIDIRLRAILPLVLEKKILIDSLHLLSPDILVTRLRSSPRDTVSIDTSLSIPQEMGRIYNSIQDALKVLKVNRFQIDKGKFSLVNKIRPEEPPVVITNIHFHLDNLQVDSTQQANQQKILFSDNVALQTTHQNIRFPDGRHRLSFSNFRINILKRIVEFDSCTIMATKGDSARNSFSIFFDKLLMTNIDFTTLYRNEIIKADSVYCINPSFRLDVDLEKKDIAAKTPPNLNDLIQQLTGDMQLAFVVVENGSFDINTVREGRPSSFTSDHNNFELQGLQVKKDGARALTVEKFVMAIRNYENFLRDSAYSIQFDSILIYNNRISLSNFTYRELENGKTANIVSMPQFELQGLSWDNLVFDRQLKAERVTLYRPVIDYNVARKRNVRSGDIYHTLAGVGNFMQLENLDIRDGQVNLFFPNNTELRLENASMSVRGRQLVESRKLNSIQGSVDGFFFRKGFFRSGDVTAALNDVHFTGGPANRIVIGTALVKNRSNLQADAKNVKINSIIVNGDIRRTTINGVSWESATVKLAGFPPPSTNGSSGFSLSRIAGSNTRIISSVPDQQFSVFLQSLRADELSTMTGRRPVVKGLRTTGNALDFAQGFVSLKIRSFEIADNSVSNLRDIHFRQENNSDSIDVTLPLLQCKPDINAIIAGKIKSSMLRLERPVINASVTAIDPLNHVSRSGRWPATTIGELWLIGPTLRFHGHNNTSQAVLEWQGEGNDIRVSGIEMGSQPQAALKVSSVDFNLQRFLYSNMRGRRFDAGKGVVNGSLRNIEVHQNESNEWDWKGVVTRLQAKQFVIDSIGKKDGTLTIDSARLSEFALESGLLPNKRELIAANTRFRLDALTGSYHNQKDQFNWYNVAYDKNTRYFSADSFSYRPTLEQAAYIAASKYQTDHITLVTGPVAIGPFDLARYVNDSIIDIGAMSVDHCKLTVFRDKRQPRAPGAIRRLPADLVRRIPARLVIDTLLLHNSAIAYAELNEKTNKTGLINVARLEGRVTRLRNYNLSGSDSLHVNATGWIEDKILTRLQVKESYTDSLGGFTMKGQMGPADLTILNPVLRPLVSAELKSGILDTLSMDVVGREELAFGSMKMFYHDLKVKVLKKGDAKRPFLAGVKNFFVNTVIKNKNSDRAGAIYFKRLRDRSAVNYLVKITLNGIINTVTGQQKKRKIREQEAILYKRKKLTVK